MNAVRASFFLPSLDEITNIDPLIVNHEATVDSVVEQMNQHGATCALVHTAGQITGIFTIYDAVRIAANTATLKSKTAREATAHPIITIPRHHPEGALAALRLLTQHQIRHLLVLSDDGTVAGVISHESICAILTPAMLMRLRTVVETMRIDVISVLADQSLLSIARTMDERQASCVVVIEVGTNGKVLPLGLITDRDIARAHAGQVDLDTTHARAQIAPQLISVSPDTNLWDAYQLMDRAHVRRLVVIAPDGRLLGLITQETLLSAATPHEIQRMIDLLQRNAGARITESLTPTRPTVGSDEARSSIRLLLVDDNEIFLQILQRLLMSRGFTIVGVASSGQEAIEQARTLQPDIILMDVEMPEIGGLEATSAIIDERPDARIVILTVAEDDETLFDAVRRGAAGYLLKDVDIDQLSQYILGLMRGEAALSPTLAQRVLSALASQMRQDSALQPDPSSILTHHQIRILTLLAQGNTYKEIGRILGYSERAIKYHTGEAIRQLKLKDRAEAIAYARAHMQRRTWPQVGDA